MSLFLAVAWTLYVRCQRRKSIYDHTHRGTRDPVRSPTDKTGEGQTSSWVGDDQRIHSILCLFASSLSLLFTSSSLGLGI